MDKLYSHQLREDRGYQVFLPDSYHAKNHAPKSYPVVYLLDGEWYKNLTWEIIKHLSANQILPELILVSIDTREHRFRDLTPSKSLLDWQGKHCDDFKDSGGLTDFLSFLEGELVPHIDGHYRTIGHRTLIGHSLGGLAVSYSYMTQAALFQGLIGIDASLWWNQRQIINEITQHLMATSRLPSQSCYFNGYADYLADNPMGLAELTQSNAEFYNVINPYQVGTSTLISQTFDNENHGSVFLPGLLAGLRAVFTSDSFDRTNTLSSELTIG